MVSSAMSLVLLFLGLKNPAPTNAKQHCTVFKKGLRRPEVLWIIKGIAILVNHTCFVVLCTANICQMSQIH